MSAQWEEDDLTIMRWTFYADDESWEGEITKHEDDYSWRVQVPAGGFVHTRTVEGDAEDFEQAKRLTLKAAEMLVAELGVEPIKFKPKLGRWKLIFRNQHHVVDLDARTYSTPDGTRPLEWSEADIQEVAAGKNPEWERIADE